MPELPEIQAYLKGMEGTLLHRRLEGVRITSPSLLRTWEPPLEEAVGREVVGLRRLGKRIVWAMSGGLFLVFHLMLTGRFRWRSPGTAVPRKRAHGAFDFPHGSLLLTEQATHKRASLHVVEGEEGLAALDPGGLEPLQAGPADFAAALRARNRTLKRALTDPRVFAGIGNAHSDEILLKAGLSPLQRTRNLTDAEVEGLRSVTREHLEAWTAKLEAEAGGKIPTRVTAFHPDMWAHGRYGEPCPRCGAPIQRIRYANRETNYCAVCQTGGKVLADRGLSRLLGEDWPRTLEELEELIRDDRG